MNAPSTPKQTRPSSRFDGLWSQTAAQAETHIAIPANFETAKPARIGGAAASAKSVWQIARSIPQGESQSWFLCPDFRTTGAVEGRIQVHLESHAALDLILVRQNDDAGLRLTRYALNLEAHSKLRVFLLNTQSTSASREEFRVDLRGEGSAASLHTLDLLGGDALKELDCSSTQRAPSTRFDIHSRSLVKHSAVLDWESSVRIEESAPQAVSRQLSKNILMTPGARALARPRLQIRNTAVDSRHGAATGHLRDEEIFYLRTRGLSPELARRTVAEGFAREWALATPKGAGQGDLSVIFEAGLADFFGDAPTWIK